MNEWRWGPHPRRDVVTIPILWLAIVLSLLVHVTALVLYFPQVHNLASEIADASELASPLAVQLTPPAREAPATPPAPPPSPAATPSPPSVARVTPQHVPRPRTPQRPATPPPMLAMPRPAPPIVAMPVPAPSPQPAPAPETTPAPPAPPAEDLASYIEARRRARGESTPSFTQGQSPDANSKETQADRLNKIIAANLGLNQTKTFGYDPRSAGGIFQIEHVDYSYAEFYFYGMDRDIGRNAKQKIEVRKGDNPDIQIAIVRKMIEIIREHESGDFIWISSREGGRQVHLSARPQDNRALEQFILADIFPEARLP